MYLYHVCPFMHLQKCKTTILFKYYIHWKIKNRNFLKTQNGRLQLEPLTFQLKSYLITLSHTSHNKK